MNFIKNPNHSYLSLSNCIRVLASDAVEKAGSGHPGMPLGMADVMTVLAYDFLKFNPNDPKWFNRDRLILSAGHGSMLLYAFYYLAGYKDFILNDIKNFRQLHSITAGHPEYGTYQAIEATTGPLGQGFANAVGMAIAAKKHQDKLGEELCNYKIYCIVGDGCLMEGISYEAASLAGHLHLNNLIVLFDDNRISIDGKTNLTVSEDQRAKFSALGWNVDSIDGHDFEHIDTSLLRAQTSNKPTFIACRTLIGKGCVNKVNSEKAHGMPLGSDEIKLLKQNLGVKDSEFFIEEELKKIWRCTWMRNKEAYDQWQANYSDFVLSNDITETFFNDVKLPEKSEPTRTSSGRVLEELIKTTDRVICGSADLSLSNNVKNSFSKIIKKDDFSGNFIHYGVREHAMAGIMNGLALSGFLPVGGTFFTFSDYMRPAIRLAAIMQRQVIYIMTHDSIGLGEDGPTHQPVEHLAAMRAMPNLLLLRPADFIETLECWKVALANRCGPSMLVLTRQSVPQIRTETSDENLSAKGAYIVQQPNRKGKVDVTIFATGSELSIALSAAAILNERNLKVKVVSVPCFELFFQQRKEYIGDILCNSKLKVAIEAGSYFGWHRIIGENGLFFGIDQFGMSAPFEELYQYFGLTAENIAGRIMKKLENL